MKDWIYLKLILNFLRSTSTDSPSSPSPVPSPQRKSSVAFMNIAGSNSSATNLAGPCTSVSIPFDVREKAYEYLQQTKSLLLAHEFWDEAETLLPHIEGRKRTRWFFSWLGLLLLYLEFNHSKFYWYFIEFHWMGSSGNSQ